jgi:hypothetical protein
MKAMTVGLVLILLLALGLISVTRRRNDPEMASGSPPALRVLAATVARDELQHTAVVMELKNPSNRPVWINTRGVVLGAAATETRTRRLRQLEPIFSQMWFGPRPWNC